MNTPPQLVMAFDYGLKRVGVATGNTLTATASPLRTLHVKNQLGLLADIGKLIAAWKPQQLVCGIPLHIDDAEQDMTIRARRFAQRLQQNFSLPVAEVDERYTSFFAADAGDLSKGEDAAAAVLILQQWLNNPQ